MTALRRIVLPYTPRALFRPYHRRTQRWACLVVHRRGGKTVAAINDKVRRAIRLELQDGRYGYVGPQLNQAKDVAWNYLKRYTAPICVDKNEGELWVEIPNAGGHRSRIRIYGADNPDRLRGGYFDGVTSDEYADMAPSVWGEIIRPMLADRQGWATFIGTIKGRNHLHELHEAHKNDPDWFTMYARASQTGIIPPSELDAMRADMSPEQYAQELELDPDAAIKGAYWGNELASAEAAGRMCLVPTADAPVQTVWDLGIGDSTAIWWWQAVGAEIRILGFYENHGMGIEHYAAVIAGKPWAKGTDWVPHDAKVRELGTGRTRVETMGKMGLRPRLVPNHKVEDGIEAARQLIGRMWFNTPDTRDGVEGLKQYRADYDEKMRTFKDRPRHDWCFTGETKVWTHNGMRRIMDLPQTGEVLTPRGWKAYNSPRVTRRNAPLVAVRFSDGLTVKCTPDHMFMTASGWKSAESLTRGSEILSCSIPLPSISMAAFTGSSQAKNTGHAAGRSCTARFGEWLLARSRAIATFITETATRTTTRWTIWNASRQPNICLSHGRNDAPTVCSTSRLKRALLRMTGTNPKPGGFGTSGMPSGQKGGLNGSAKTALAIIAAWCSKPWPVKADIPNGFAGLTAKPRTIESVVPLNETADVWCMTVPGVEAFALENGAIVHNCSHRADAFRYLAMAYRELVPKPEPEKGRLLAVGPLNQVRMDDLWPAEGQRNRTRL